MFTKIYFLCCLRIQLEYISQPLTVLGSHRLCLASETWAKVVYATCRFSIKHLPSMWPPYSCFHVDQLRAENLLRRLCSPREMDYGVEEAWIFEQLYGCALTKDIHFGIHVSKKYVFSICWVIKFGDFFFMTPMLLFL